MRWPIRYQLLVPLLTLLLGVVGISLAISGAAYAWSDIDGKGNIKCRDSSMAKVEQRSDGTWTATQAGRNGHTGGSFGIEGQAAMYACGEGA